MSTPAEELIEAVSAAAAETPYRVNATEHGFDLRIDLQDVRWHGFLERVGRRGVVENHVVLDCERRTMRITDEHYDVRWVSGESGARAPHLAARIEATRTLGRTWEVQYEVPLGGHARTGEPAEQQFTTADGHRMIREAAAELGWSEKAGIYQRIGIAFAIVGALTAVAVGALLIYYAVTGQF
ncbi:hypothetical protein Cch01nite_07780 [Cellulomonas chitinilytica]|uniref:Uncharacterized protein n=1 Tax=Cellulomonas chitinilytica TaxID=398759 RepID=A0A919P2S9_9CELL|nr:hypothetical protein [Cellulomonas chitinilytica]GIG20054.1 hypothetical protein Cch01nite_07780 [Cellulomonas chitinilytica]